MTNKRFLYLRAPIPLSNHSGQAEFEQAGGEDIHAASRCRTRRANGFPRFGRARANVVDNLPLQMQGKFLTFLQQLNEPVMSGISSRQESPGYQYTVTCGELYHALR